MKIKLLLLFFAVFCLMLSCRTTRVAQQSIKQDVNYIPYYLKVYEADSLFLVGNYHRSYEILDSLFKKFEPINMEGYSEYFTYVKSAVGSKHLKNIKGITKKAVVDYGAIVSIFKQDSIMNIALQESGYTDGDLEIFIKQHKDKLNLTLRDTIERMIERDQAVRGKKYVSDDRLEEVSQENMDLLKVIFSKYGYPSHKKIGYSLLNDKDIDLGAVFLHSSIAFKREFLLERLLHYAKIGACMPSFYATTYDRVLLDESSFDGAQLYGQFQSQNLKLVDAPKVDSIRKAVGLPSLHYDTWRYNKLFGDFFK